MRFWFSVLILSLLAEQAASAQSLADIARREAERRKEVASGRVITNADLAPVDSVVAPQTPSPAVPAASAADAAKPAAESGADAKRSEQDAGSATPAKPREKRDEPYWRARAQDLRQRLAKVNSDVAAAESRLVDMDAVPGSSQTAREREVTAAALARLQADARARLEELQRFEAFAQAQKIPPDWIR